MNRITHENEQEFDYQVDSRGAVANLPTTKRRPAHIRRSRPAVHNGMHRRRNKRMLAHVVGRSPAKGPQE